MRKVLGHKAVCKGHSPDLTDSQKLPNFSKSFPDLFQYQHLQWYPEKQLSSNKPILRISPWFYRRLDLAIGKGDRGRWNSLSEVFLPPTDVPWSQKEHTPPRNKNRLSSPFLMWSILTGYSGNIQVKTPTIQVVRRIHSCHPMTIRFQAAAANQNTS